MELQRQNQPRKEVPPHSRQMLPKESPTLQDLQQTHAQV